MTLTAAKAIPLNSSGIVAHRRTIANRNGRDQVSVLALLETGELVEEIGRGDTAAEDEIVLRPGILTVVDPVSGKSTVVRNKSQIHKDTQTDSAAGDRDFVVWTELRGGTELASTPWVMYVADRSTGRVAEVTRAQPVNSRGETPTVPGYTIPSVNQGWVYWAETRANPRKGKPVLAHVYGRKLDLSEPAKLIARNAIMPTATGDWLYYADFDPEKGFKHHTVMRKSLRTGQVDVVHRSKVEGRGHGLTGVAAHGDLVAWIFSRDIETKKPGSTVHVARGLEPVAHVEAPGASLGWPAVGPNTIGFVDTSSDRDDSGGNYLLDLRGGCLHNLGNAMGLASVKLAGRVVMWSMSDGGSPPRMQWQHGRLR